MLDRRVDPLRLVFVSTLVNKTDTSLCRHFKHTGHLPSKVSIRPVEKNIYDSNSSSRLKI